MTIAQIDADNAAKLNWLRAGVLGANDGIVSVSAIVVGVAAAAQDTFVLFITAIAALLAGATSMALGEYVSVAAQRDSEIAMGVEKELLVKPWHAAIASAVAFTAGAILPILAILLPPANLRVPVTVFAVLVALAITGWVSAELGHTSKVRSILRMLIGGSSALAATWIIGSLLGTHVG